MTSVAQYLLKWDSLLLICVTECLRKKRAIRIMQWISRSADGQVYPALLVLVSVMQFDRWNILAAGILSFAIEFSAYKLIKQSVKRPRPFHQLAGLENLIIPQDAFSFPSGHTAGAFVVATIIGFCNPLCLIPACFWASLVGFSRVYLGVHYPSDVAVGVCLGILSARAGLLITNHIIMRPLF